MPRPKPIRLPEDGLAHRAAIEWWYFNGHLSDSARRGGSRRYAFMSSFFKADESRALVPSLKNPIPNVPYVYFAHTVVSDIARKKSYKAIAPICIVSRDSFTRPLLFVDYINPLGLARGYASGEIVETAPGAFRIKSGLFDLQLVARKKPLLEGGNGYVSVCGKHSYYYSFTDLAARGSVKIGKQWVGVKGKAWMDHQWANVSWSNDKWTWFSLQLHDGTDLMCVEYDDGKRKDYLVDVVNKNGRTEHYKKMRLAPGGDVWKSKETGASYPMSWRIEIPEMAALINVRALLRDQEMVSGALHYWEGPLGARGRMSGKEISGEGFMELVGYPARRAMLQEAGERLYKMIGRKLKGGIW